MSILYKEQTTELISLSVCHSLYSIYSNIDINKHITSVQKNRKCLPSIVCEEGIVIINPGPTFSLVEAKIQGYL